MADRNFGGIIWTNHALQRLGERGISQSDAYATWKNPQQERYAKAQGAWVYYRTYPSAGSGQVAQKIEVVAKQNEKKEWIVLSVWSRPVYEKYSKPESFLNFLFKKIFAKIAKK